MQADSMGAIGRGGACRIMPKSRWQVAKHGQQLRRQVHPERNLAIQKKARIFQNHCKLEQRVGTPAAQVYPMS